MTSIWKYTDDLIIGAIISTWIYGKITGSCMVEDQYMLACLTYVFGNVVAQSKEVLKNATKTA